MATPRKRSTSLVFSPTEEEQSQTENGSMEETSETSSQEMFETFLRIDETPQQVAVDVMLPEDPQSSPVEKSQEPVKSKQTAVVLPKRQPRNIPKFSRFKQQ